MKSRFVLSLFAAVAALGVVGFTAGTAHAVRYPQTATFTVPINKTPNDLHVTFTGTGGSIANVTVAPPVGAGSITVNPGNTINVVWDAKLAPGTVVTITFNSNFPGVAFSSGTWTNNSVVIHPVTTAAESTSVTQGTQIPGASPLVMLLIAIAVATGGALMLRRRAEA